MARSFDTVAAVYDATRALPPEAEAAIAAGIARLGAAAPGASLLEIGVGTGRIAVPLARAGLRVAGVDISAAMLAAARDKLPGRLLLARADALALPFADAAFDIGLVVHVFHLIAEWPRALAEALRTIRPGGHFLYGSEGHEPGDDLRAIEGAWRAILARHGVAQRGHRATDAALLDALRERGMALQAEVVATWPVTNTVGATLDRYTSRVYSSSWTIPEPIFTQASAELIAWAREHYPDPAQPLDAEGRFTITAARR